MSHNKQVTDSDRNNSRASQSTQAQASSTSTETTSGEINHLDDPRVLSDEASAQSSTAASEKHTKSNTTNGQKSDINSPKQLPLSQPPEQNHRGIQQRYLSSPPIANQYLDMGPRRNQNGRRTPIAQPHNQQPTNLLTDTPPPENSPICQETYQPADDSEPDQDQLQNQDITAIEHLQVCAPATSLEEPDLPLCYQFISLENGGLPRFSYLLVIYSTQNLPQPNLM
ncbi:uncharacterized protein LOC128218438 [Mya arenaria]|uniref:uncharacterized protein LOC128218438 n=1 Tax=Mya arenaria TaxID=6604 RepID=UPI0022E10AA1|nr:uncharacterized protein LOC128218438 [Mya arenaria]XP_052782065.1 uncharacterized protein LOC128218438 [Mya arenaria]